MLRTYVIKELNANVNNNLRHKIDQMGPRDCILLRGPTTRIEGKERCDIDCCLLQGVQEIANSYVEQQQELKERRDHLFHDVIAGEEKRVQELAFKWFTCILKNMPSHK